MLFADGVDARVIDAIGRLPRGELAILGEPAAVRALAESRGISLAGVEVIAPSALPRRHELAELIAKRRGTETWLADRLLDRPSYAALALLAAGAVESVVVGVTSHTAEVLIACEMCLGLAEPGRAASSAFVLDLPAREGMPARRVVLADCAVNPRPTAEQLAEIALATAETARGVLAESPRVALLSFSTHGSAQHPDVDKVVRATALAHARRPELALDGELQADAALDRGVAEHKREAGSPVGDVMGRANVLVFPDLDAANIGYKLVRELAGASAYGAFLQGFGHRVAKLSRGSTAAEIAGTAQLLRRLGG
ncbi:MAG: phosphate acyltransferase [Deltaproteobacteria bacterium]